MKKAIFFDKDGTLVENVPYNVDPEKIVFVEGAYEAINVLRSEFEFHIITNQAGVAFGLFKENELFEVEKKIQEFFLAANSKLSGFHYCPHHPLKNCECRKPGTLLLENACQKFNIDPKSSWLIGDILDDIEAGNKMGMNTILVDVGNETQWDLSGNRIPDFKVNHFSEIPVLIAKVMYAELE